MAVAAVEQRTLNLRTTSLRGSTGVAVRGEATAARLATTLLLASIILAVLEQLLLLLRTLEYECGSLLGE
jgi:hypothetical protein